MSDDTRRCLKCMMKTCAVCGEEKRQLLFAVDQWAVKDGPRRCYVCNKTRCVRCHKLKVHKMFCQVRGTVLATTLDMFAGIVSVGSASVA